VFCSKVIEPKHKLPTSFIASVKNNGLSNRNFSH